MRIDFLQLTPISKLNWNSISISTEEEQDELLRQTILSDIALKYPPSLSYQRRFCQAIIKKLDQEYAAFSETLIQVYQRILDEGREVSHGSSDSNHTGTNHGNFSMGIGGGLPRPCYKTFLFDFHSQNQQNAKFNTNNTNNVITKGQASRTYSEAKKYVVIKEDLLKITGGTTGLRVWSACLRFIDYLFQNPSIVQDKAVLELGAGTGLLGLTTMHLGASKAILTDAHSLVMDRLTENIDIFKTEFPHFDHDAILDAILDWETPNETSLFTSTLKKSEEFVVLSSDVIYDPSILPLLQKTLDYLFFKLKPEIAVCSKAYIASFIRQQSTFDQFIHLLQQSNYGQNTHENLKIEILDLPAPSLCRFYLDEEYGECKLICLSKNLKQLSSQVAQYNTAYLTEC